MRYMVQYIPLSKIKPDIPANMTQRMKQLQRFLTDCMHLLIVRKNKKDGNFIILSGHNRYEHLIKHTNKKYAPCIVDQSRTAAAVHSLFHRFRSKRIPLDVPHMNPDSISPASWAVIRSFLKQEPRFAHLSRSQQFSVLILGIRYKKTVISAMRAKIDKILAR
ncbi:hypothetical protein [Ferviditalea candida]|uniref:ParB/Sulfiredoxin domain-containing protein n=1 Tax=Ferviditalea candida TaxID=3108399 RepID=A0ABU5ZJB5_9BACL|nr:hypothetical protein [Paenibacillaceae bacterium T2]